ncbi:hypothetical protein A2853_00780 [Candidatus Kaiserbacteria bacterium RIFCSPHIGHO2_01_FULL_55_17]|uniref:Transcriptional repressor PaaX-like central Cas2-like domain-containing protein n=1 Tax=Candidatus Kaiserbacteria bacterium RIFCSPHIGHO2_01_FULL_55_17 TaxID=1798484 RepID=A0A1F6D995_9BACT|nr:MAG: hypothetical protein A2853_00780 [Candidatus Kaiserbacteria bacterium RIFCSPHIGHO2_01_FULL_55_17]
MRHKPRRRRPKLGSAQRAILSELSGGDLLVGFLLSGRSTKRMYRIARERAMRRYRDKLAIEQLANLEYIRVQDERLSITKKGRGALGEIVSSTRRTLGERAWDGKWRIVLFDIPESYAALRDRIRAILKEAGFVQLQQSVWVFPHECEELAQFIRSEPRIARYVLYGVLERVNEEGRLKKQFRLI